MSFFAPSTIIWYIGLATVLVGLRRVASFLHVYALHSSTVQRYLTDDDKAFALVTGASDGLGKELVLDLYDRGYNIMLHGRNPAKLEAVRDELLSSTKPKREVKIFVADAVEHHSWDFSPLEGIKFTAIFLVAGGSHPVLVPVDEMTDEAIEWTIRYNSTFHTTLLRFLIPRIRTAGVPAFVVGIGALAQYHPPPFLTTYAASKDYLSKFIHGLDQEQKFIDPTLDISFQFMPVGPFVSRTKPSPIPTSVSYTTGISDEAASTHGADALSSTSPPATPSASDSASSSQQQTAPTLFSPPARTIARAVLSAVGCGHRTVVPYLPHLVGLTFLWAIGRTRSDRFIAWWFEKYYMSEGMRRRGRRD